MYDHATGGDWKEFKKKHPKAAVYLAVKSIIGEYVQLRDKEERTDEEERRFKNLGGFLNVLHSYPELFRDMVGELKEVTDE